MNMSGLPAEKRGKSFKAEVTERTEFAEKSDAENPRPIL
jgi:hypothetical protein